MYGDFVVVVTVTARLLFHAALEHRLIPVTVNPRLTCGLRPNMGATGTAWEASEALRSWMRIVSSLSVTGSSSIALVQCGAGDGGTSGSSSDDRSSISGGLGGSFSMA